MARPASSSGSPILGEWDMKEPGSVLRGDQPYIQFFQRVIFLQKSPQCNATEQRKPVPGNVEMDEAVIGLKNKSGVGATLGSISAALSGPAIRSSPEELGGGVRAHFPKSAAGNRAWGNVRVTKLNVGEIPNNYVASGSRLTKWNMLVVDCICMVDNSPWVLGPCRRHLWIGCSSSWCWNVSGRSSLPE